MDLPIELRPFESTAARSWDRRKVAHLFRRACFGAQWLELERGVHMGPQQCVDHVLTGRGATRISEGDFAGMARTAVAAGSDAQLQGWWLFRMLAGPHALAERMTLFWHDHFATSQAKVANLELMLRQNELFRYFALGRFWDRDSGGLLLAVSQDPAMLVWLDSNSNRRAAPNENYAREVMELFALGVGQYTERDIREAARAFTGWFVQRDEFRFVDSEHDPDSKTVLGRTGNWDGDDVVRIIAEQPAAAVFLARKLYRAVVSETEEPDPVVLDALAQGLRDHDFEVRWALETLLRSNLFYSDSAYRRRITSPVEFTVGTVHRLEGERVSPVRLAEVCSRLGQTLFHPPNVAGWEGGRAWINASSHLGRVNFAQAITARSGGPFAGRTDPAGLAAKYGCKSDREVLEFFLDLFVDGDVSDETRGRLAGAVGKGSADERARHLVQLVLSLPEYQLC